MFIDRDLYVNLKDYVEKKRTSAANVVSRLVSEFLEDSEKERRKDFRGRQSSFDIATKTDITFIFATDDLYVRLKSYAKENKISLVSIVNSLLRDFFDVRNDEIRSLQCEDKANRSLPQVRRWARLTSEEKKEALEPLNEGLKVARSDLDFCEKYRETQIIAQNQSKTVAKRSKSIEERVRLGLHHWINRATYGRRNVFYERLLDPLFTEEMYEANVNRRTTEKTIDHSALWETDYSNLKLKIDVEIDESDHLKHQDRDQRRNEVFRKDGWLVLRYWWHDVELRMDRVVQMSYFAFNRRRKEFKQFQLPKLKWNQKHQILAEKIMRDLQAQKLKSVLEALTRATSLERAA